MCITVVMTGDLHAVSHSATTGTNVRLTASIERYFADLGWMQTSSEAIGGRSSYGPRAHLPDVVRATSKPKVFRVGEPIDLEWSLASYAREGLARVEVAGNSSSLWAARTALEEALDGRFECREGARFLRPPPMPTLFYGVFSVSMLRARQLPLPAGGFDKRMAVRHLRRCSRRCSSSPPIRTARNRWVWRRCWAGRRLSIGWTRPPLSRRSTRASLRPASASRSSRPSTPSHANGSAPCTRFAIICF